MGRPFTEDDGFEVEAEENGDVVLRVVDRPPGSANGGDWFPPQKYSKIVPMTRNRISRKKNATIAFIIHQTTLASLCNLSNSSCDSIIHFTFFISNPPIIDSQECSLQEHRPQHIRPCGLPQFARKPLNESFGARPVLAHVAPLWIMATGHRALSGRPASGPRGK